MLCLRALSFLAHALPLHTLGANSNMESRCSFAHRLFAHVCPPSMWGLPRRKPPSPPPSPSFHSATVRCFDVGTSWCAGDAPHMVFLRCLFPPAPTVFRQDPSVSICQTQPHERKVTKFRGCVWIIVSPFTISYQNSMRLCVERTSNLDLDSLVVLTLLFTMGRSLALGVKLRSKLTRSDATCFTA